ncbi:MAG TPA: hypothetical protein DHW82_12565 [Spirochaetia bacterium]|nr:MAG: hypothetical protein A2Y41_07410 [Spirochaetes bacterium GWB1_36_13]HCL57822.1 hypothetical protein [Spirochaetia bacterium]
MKTELKVGFFVFFSFLFLMGSVAYLGKSALDVEGKEYGVVLKFLNDLKPGSEVKFAGGITVGYVKEILPEPKNNKVILKIWLKKDFPVTSNVLFTVLGEGMLGEKYLNVSFPETGEEEIKDLAEGTMIQGKDSVGFGEVLQSTYELAQQMSETVDSINFILNGLTKRKDIERLSDSAVKLLKESLKMIDDNKNNISAILQEALQSSKTLSSLLNKELPQVVKNTNNSVLSISRDLTSLIQDLKGLVASVKKGEGVLGTVLVDQKLADDLKDLIINLKKVSELLVNNPLLSEQKKNQDFSWQKK